MKATCFRITVALTLLTMTGLMAAGPHEPGTVLWEQKLTGKAHHPSAAYSVVVDNQGNAVAAGYTANTGIGVAILLEFAVAKFDRDGTLLWQQNLNGTYAFEPRPDTALSVAVDSHGNVVAAGVTWNTRANSDLTVAKFDRDGTLLWRQDLNDAPLSLDEAFSVAVDQQGNVVAAGDTHFGDHTGNFTVVKFDR